MNGTAAQARALTEAVCAGVSEKTALLRACDILLCPPFIHIDTVRESVSGGVLVGAQDCAVTDNGAFTGDVSAAMLADAGCSHVIIGHSERRQYHGESDSEVKAKAQRALDVGLVPIICVGETQAQREAGHHFDVVTRQIREGIPTGGIAQEIVIAYEPVWAIGTGKIPTMEDIAAMHAHIDICLGGGGIRILYGGSMKPENAKDILALDKVGGGLIGGASLKVDQFLAIASAG